MLEADGMGSPLVVTDYRRLIAQICVEHTVPIQRRVSLRILVAVLCDLLLHPIVSHLAGIVVSGCRPAALGRQAEVHPMASFYERRALRLDQGRL